MPEKLLTSEIWELARALGFDAMGITSARAFPEAEAALVDRIERGFLTGLSWFTLSRARRSCLPTSLLPGAQSILSVALSYWAREPGEAGAAAGPRGQVSRYAWGSDYHAVMRGKLARLADFLAIRWHSRSRIVVDTGPLVEKAVAQRAGVGWFGKNTTIITSKYGSWVFLGEVVTDAPLEPDEPLEEGCGDCALCLAACPTGALVEPYVLDSRRCISFLTVEHKGAIPPSLRPLIGNRIFGCDTCQEVCPRNSHIQPAQEGPFAPVGPDWSGRPSLLPLLALGEEEFRHTFGASPLRRAGRAGLLRNVAIALGNIGDAAAVPALASLLGDPNALVRGHAAWALGRIGGRQARSALESARRGEPAPWVRQEIEEALM